MIAHMVESCLFPIVGAVVDLHSGRKASNFAPCALAARRADGGLDDGNIALARAFGAPLIWVLGRNNDNRSVNGAATRAGLPFIAAELGGGGAIDMAALDIAEAELQQVLAYLGMIEGAPKGAAEPRLVELASASQSVLATAHGLYQPLVSPGSEVNEGDALGLLHALDHAGEAPSVARAPVDGVVLAETRRGLAQPGDFLALVASDAAKVQAG